jgi:hypothetical protein
MRATFITLALEDGADPHLIETSRDPYAEEVLRVERRLAIAQPPARRARPGLTSGAAQIAA